MKTNAWVEMWAKSNRIHSSGPSTSRRICGINQHRTNQKSNMLLTHQTLIQLIRQSCMTRPAKKAAKASTSCSTAASRFIMDFSNSLFGDFSTMKAIIKYLLTPVTLRPKLYMCEMRRVLLTTIYMKIMLILLKY